MLSLIIQVLIAPYLGMELMKFNDQFPPNDPGKLMITSADSVIRVLSGLDVVCKLKGQFAGCIDYLTVSQLYKLQM